eukprot:scaffold825_cov249-Pinguiococcus_pyrenoidosus.AAC.63
MVVIPNERLQIVPDVLRRLRAEENRPYAVLQGDADVPQVIVDEQRRPALDGHAIRLQDLLRGTGHVALLASRLAAASIRPRVVAAADRNLSRQRLAQRLLQHAANQLGLRREGHDAHEDAGAQNRRNQLAKQVSHVVRQVLRRRAPRAFGVRGQQRPVEVDRDQLDLREPQLGNDGRDVRHGRVEGRISSGFCLRHQFHDLRHAVHQVVSPHTPHRTAASPGMSAAKPIGLGEPQMDAPTQGENGAKRPPLQIRHRISDGRFRADPNVQWRETPRWDRRKPF